MNWRKWLSMGMAAALVICLSNLDMVQAAEDSKTATAYLYFKDSNWSETNYLYPGGESHTKTIGTDAEITGDGTYHLALDFTQTANQHINDCLNAKICIVDGETVFGSDSIITVQKVTINGLEWLPYEKGFTASEIEWWNPVTQGKITNTIFNLFDSNANVNINNIQGDRVEGAQRTAEELSPYSDFGSVEEIKTIEVDFSFSVNRTIKPSGSPDPNETSDPNKTPDPNETSNPNKTPDPNESSKPNKTPNPSESSKPNKTPGPNESSKPNTTQKPNQSGGLVSNSTYTGAEKIIVQNNSVVIPAGGSSTVTFALLRSAGSGTQVSVSSGNTGIASPVLQDNGKVRIIVPGTAAAGSTTTVTLRFGSSSASIKVTVRNAVSKVKAAKKSYKVKRKKKTKVVFQITAKNKSKATTDEPFVKLSGKKATISSVKLSGSKLTVTVKGVKKGSTTLKATVGGKTAKTKLKIK